MAEITANASGVVDASAASAQQNGVTGTGEGSSALETIKVGGEEISLPPEQASILKQRMKMLEKGYFQKFDALASEKKAFESERTSRLSELEKMQGLLRGQSAGERQLSQDDILAQQNPEYAAAIAKIKQIASEMTATEVKALKAEIESLKGLEKRFAETQQRQQSNEVVSEAKSIINASGLSKADASLFTNYFIGKYNVDQMPPTTQLDDYGREVPGVLDVLKAEIKEFSKRFKNAELLKNKEYIDGKEATKKLATDARGVAGVGGEAKPLTASQKEERRLGRMLDLAKKHIPNGVFGGR